MKNLSNHLYNGNITHYFINIKLSDEKLISIISFILLIILNIFYKNILIKLANYGFVFQGKKSQVFSGKLIATINNFVAYCWGRRISSKT